MARARATQVYRRNRNQQPGTVLRVTTLARSDHPIAMGESEPSVTAPRTSPPAIVRCCETPAVLKNPDERSGRNKRELQQGPMWPIQHNVVQGQHRAVSPCEFKYQKFWYSVPRMWSLFRSLTLFLARSGSLAVTGGLGGARGRLGCVGLSPGKLNPVVSP